MNEDLNNLTKSLPFVIVKMGLELYDLTKNFDKNDYKEKTSDDFYNDYLSKNSQINFIKIIIYSWKNTDLEENGN